jgi:pyruvate-formate lyase
MTGWFSRLLNKSIIPDFRYTLQNGVENIINELKQKSVQGNDTEKRNFLDAMIISLETVLILAGRYADIAEEMAEKAKGSTTQHFTLVADTLRRVPRFGAISLYEAIQSYLLLSVKLHKDTSQNFYEELGRFFFTPGCLTPSLFNDDTLFELLPKNGISREDIPDYSVAGCHEPLIMGKDNGNTTNSWLNLGKILGLSLHDGVSVITGKNSCFR